jgi:ferredoxin
MKVTIDQSKCQGHGRCYSIAPELFEPDDVGQGQVIGDGVVPPSAEPDAHRAVLNCPEGAITIEESGA